MTINEQKLQKLLETAVTDFGATCHTALVNIGDKLGLYKALAANGPLTPAGLAERTERRKRRQNSSLIHGVTSVRQPSMPVRFSQ